MTMPTWDQIFADIERLTSPQGSWSIERDEHRSNYYSVADALRGYSGENFETEAERARAIAINRMVTLQWYVETPVGSYTISAADMDALKPMAVKLIAQVEKERSNGK